MKFRGIEVDEICLELSGYKEEIQEEEAYDYFYEQLEDKLEGDAYLDEVDDGITLVRFERDTDRETLDYVIDFYNKHIRDNDDILDHCKVELEVDLEDFITDEDGDQINAITLQIEKLDLTEFED